MSFRAPLHRLLRLVALCGVAFICASTMTHASDYERLNWQTLPSLPRAAGGQMAGTSGGALVVIGGSYFEVAPFEGGTKLWLDTLLVLEPGAKEWRQTGRLAHPLGYGAAVTMDDSVIVIGGADARGHYADVFRLRWLNGKLEQTALPALPQTLANHAAALIGKTIFVMGGQLAPTATEASNKLFALDLGAAQPHWRELPALPGPARILPAMAAQGGQLYVFSGAELARSADGRPVRRYLNDGWRYDVNGQWTPLAALPRPIVAAPAINYGQAHILTFSGDDGAQAERIQELKHNHPGFSRDALAYHTITNTWTKFGTVPESLVTTAVVLWQNKIVITGGEDRPGHRAATVAAAQLVEPHTRFGLLNYTVLIVYLAANLLVGVWFARRQKNTNDYFRGGQRITWWAAGIAIFGTQLSSLTFMAIPAKTYSTDWTFILANAAIVLIAPIVVFFYLPFFRRLDITSAYEYLERRFNLAVRLFGSASFVLMQTARLAIILYLPSLALAVITDLNIYVCILTMGCLSTVYTMLGGAEAVTWTEVLQFFILVGAAVTALVLAIAGAEGGASQVLATALADGKLHAFDWRWDYTTATVAVVLGGNLFAQLVPYTSDQAVIQRYLTTPTERGAAQAIWLNALFVIPATLIFFSIGTALYVFYKQQPQLLGAATPTDAIFPLFIVSQMPAGLSGLVIAGLFAAGQSGSQASIATALVTDFYRRFRPAAGEAECVRLARALTLLLGAIGIGTALLMATYNIRSLWDVFLQTLGLLGGGLAGVFALGVFTKRAHSKGALVGVAMSAVVLFLVQRYTPVHFFLYAAVGIFTCLIVGYLASLLIPAAPQSLAGLTIHTAGARGDRAELVASRQATETG